MSASIWKLEKLVPSSGALNGRSQCVSFALSQAQGTHAKSKPARQPPPNLHSPLNPMRTAFQVVSCVIPKTELGIGGTQMNGFNAVWVQPKAFTRSKL